MSEEGVVVVVVLEKVSGVEELGKGDISEK